MLTYLVRRVGKAASGEEEVGLVLSFSRSGGRHQVWIRSLGASAAHQPGHLSFQLSFTSGYALMSLTPANTETAHITDNIQEQLKRCFGLLKVTFNLFL